MYLILTSQDDIASLNIREKLLRMADWEEIGEFQGFPAHTSGRFYMVHIKGPKIYAERVDDEIREKLGIEFDAIIVASKHRSAAEIRSLTVHPIGNWGKAEFGGRDRDVVLTEPHLMTNALRILKRNNDLEDYTVSFEATHHGPYLTTPTFFIEIGSNEEEWENERAGEIIAKTILELEPMQGTTLIGIGGGHYVPRMGDLALQYRVSFGHMIPSYAVEYVDEESIRKACENTPGCQGAYVHRKGLKGEQRRKIMEILNSLGIRVFSSKDLERL